MIARRLLCALCLVLFVTPTRADMFAPSHGCRKPIKPYAFKTDWDVQNFRSDVDRYRRCIETFVDEQDDAIRKHRAAADDAIDDWNRYVEYELR